MNQDFSIFKHHVNAAQRIHHNFTRCNGTPEKKVPSNLISSNCTLLKHFLVAKVVFLASFRASRWNPCRMSVPSALRGHELRSEFAWISRRITTRGDNSTCANLRRVQKCFAIRRAVSKLLARCNTELNSPPGLGNYVDLFYDFNNSIQEARFHTRCAVLAFVKRGLSHDCTCEGCPRDTSKVWTVIGEESWLLWNNKNAESVLFTWVSEVKRVRARNTDERRTKYEQGDLSVAF